MIKNMSHSFWCFVDARAVVRRTVLFITLWMTWRSFTWAAEFASTYNGENGVDLAAVIAAVTAPISMLQGYVFKVYSEGRKE